MVDDLRFKRFNALRAVQCALRVQGLEQRDFSTTPSYGHPSGLPPAPPEGEGRKKEGTTLGVAPLPGRGGGRLLFQDELLAVADDEAPIVVRDTLALQVVGCRGSGGRIADISDAICDG